MPARFQSLLSRLTVGQWYNIWMVVNNSTDKWDAYVNTGTANATAGDLKLSNIGFRNGAAANDLTIVSTCSAARAACWAKASTTFTSAVVSTYQPLGGAGADACASLCWVCAIVMLKRRGRVSKRAAPESKSFCFLLGGNLKCVSENILARLLIVISGALSVLPAGAAVLDDFNTYTAGQVAAGVTGGNWTTLGNADGGVIQSDSGNLLLTVGSADGGDECERLPHDSEYRRGQYCHDRVHARSRQHHRRAQRLVRPGGRGACGPSMSVGQFEAQFRLITRQVYRRSRPATPASSKRSCPPSLRGSGTTSGWWSTIPPIPGTPTSTPGPRNATAGDLKLSGHRLSQRCCREPFDPFRSVRRCRWHPRREH